MVSIGTISYLGSHGAELLRAGWTESVLDPGIADWVRRIHEFGREADTVGRCAAAASGSRTRARSSRSTGAGAPDEEAARAAIDAIAAKRGGRRPAHALGAQGARGAPAGAGWTRASGSSTSSMAPTSTPRCTPATTSTDLDAFRALTQLKDEGKISYAVRVGVRSDEGPAQITEEADVVVDGTEGVQHLLASLVAD